MGVETQWPFLDPGDPCYADDANEAPKWKEKDIEHQVNSMVSRSFLEACSFNQFHVPSRIAESRDRWHQMTFWAFASFCILFTLVVEWPAQANWQVKNCSAPDFLPLTSCRHAVHPSTCSHWPCMGGISFPSGMQWEHWFCQRWNGHSHDDHHHDHDHDGDHDQHFNCGGMIQDDFWRLSTKAGIFETMNL